MIPSDLKIVLERQLSGLFAKEVKIDAVTALSGGCIHNAAKAETSAGVFFIKYNYDIDPTMFASEAMGLQLIKDAKVIHTPEVYIAGAAEKFMYLILEFIESTFPKKDYWRNFGNSLAALHQKSNEQYGLSFNNFIGSLPQSNKVNPDWLDLFIQERLMPQVKLAMDSGKINQKIVRVFENLFTKLSDLLVLEKPSLLHGDLWSGNVMINSTGDATLIDPAVYYGNREVELAFTQLFGGFNEEFYQSYKEVFPLEAGYEERFDLYNLYPLMVHVNLFGGGYLDSVIRVLRRFT